MDELSLGSFLWRGGAVLALIAANAYFVAAAFSLVASRRTRIDAMAEAGDTKAKLAQKAIQSLDRYISGTQLGITVSSIGLGWIGEPALAGVVESAFGGISLPLEPVAIHGVAVAIAFMIITFLHIVLGELAPKAIALQHPEATSRWVAGPLIGFTEATNPFIWLLNGSANLLLRLLGARPPSEAERVHQPEEIVMLVKQTQRTGALEKGDVRMIEGVFEFTEKLARDVMTPRTGVVGLEAGTPVEAAVAVVAESGRSRFPVYRATLDDVVGVVHVKDILGAMLRDPSTPVERLAREPLFVPGSREVEDVLADMKRLKRQLAVVLDEYGGMAGIVTMEDLLEEIVGEIYDEYDTGEPAPQAGPEGVTVPGAMALDETSEKLELELDDETHQTLGGYVFARLGRLPKPGDRVSIPGGALEVVEMDGKRVGKVRVLRERS